MVPRFDSLAGAAAAAFNSSGSDATAVAANLELARRLGLTALTVPSGEGGLGANLLDFASFQEISAQADGATALVLAMHLMLIGGEAEAGLWPAAEWQALCRSAREGVLVNSAATEPGAGTPSQGGLPATRADPSEAAQTAPGSAWLLTGRKTYTTGAPYLGRVRVSARVEPARGPAFGARFLVALPAPGLSIEDRWHPSALAAAANHDLAFDRTPATLLYPEDGRGCEGTVWFQVAIAATYLGIGFAAHRAAAEYARDRVTAAGPMLDRETVRLRLGRSRGRLEVARRNLLWTCAEWVELAEAERPSLLPVVGLAKVTAVNAAAAAAEDAIRLAGAGGFGTDQPFARFLLETRAGLSHPPIDEVAWLALAQEALPLPE
jgi:alkylation response protein AidB-like acyl-CoA dehydrogenase